jgi:hypothetical protein
MNAKRMEEAELRSYVSRNRELAAEIGDPWARIAAAQEAQAAILEPYTYLEEGAGFNSRLFRYARAIVRGAAERAKPNTERLREFTESALPRIEQQLGTSAPVYPELERLTLSFSLERMREWLGPDDRLVRDVLGSESPDSLAAKLIDSTQLADPKVREALWNGGVAAVEASSDPMIKLARRVDTDARVIRKRFEDDVEAPTDRASERIAAARFKALGTSIYPDATFTLRLNFGKVQGWKEKGEPVVPFTTLKVAFDRATGKDPFRMPARWVQAKSTLNLDTRFNLSTTNDIVGGNSGSPLINAKGELVGLMFDGNIHSISGSYWFDADLNRAIAVHPAIVREGLTKVYRAEALLKEIGAK